MSFEGPPKKKEQDTSKVGRFEQAETERGIAGERIARAKNFEELNTILRDLGDMTVEGSADSYSMDDLQGRITDLRDMLDAAEEPADINDVEGNILTLTRELGIRDKVQELLADRIKEKKAQIAGEALKEAA